MRFVIRCLVCIVVIVYCEPMQDDYFFWKRALQEQYFALITHIAKPGVTCSNQDQLLEDLDAALYYYTSEKELGFTKDMYFRALQAFVREHCGRGHNI